MAILHYLRKGCFARRPLFVYFGLPPSVPLLGDKDPYPDDDPCLVVFVWLGRGQSVVPYGAVGNPNVVLVVMVVQRCYAAKIVMLLTTLEVDDLSFLCHYLFLWCKYNEK